MALNQEPTHPNKEWQLKSESQPPRRMAVVGGETIPDQQEEEEEEQQQHRQQQASTRTSSAATCGRNSLFRATLSTLFLDPFLLILWNPTFFFLVYLFLTLPLACLLTSLSLASFPIQSRIRRLESLSRFIEIRIEALNILEEAHGESQTLLRLRAIHAPPCLVLSLVTLVVVATAAVCAGGRASVKQVAEKVKDVWWRVMVTGLVAHAAAAGLGEVVRSGVGLGMGRGGMVVGMGLGVVGWVVEVHLTALMGMGMMVAVVEERWGVDAVRVGWELMKGRRICGWIVTGVVAAAVGCVRWEIEGMRCWLTTAGYAWRSGVVCLLGLLLLWANLAAVVYYCDCRRRRPLGNTTIIASHHSFGTLNGSSSINDANDV